MTRTDIAWPKVTDEPFVGKGPPHLVVEMDWIGMDTLPAYREGYKIAADFAVDAVEARRLKQHPDVMAFPVFFLYRHFLELSLKELVLVGRAALRRPLDRGELDRLFGTHVLQELWAESRKVLAQLYPKKRPAELAVLDRFVRAFHKADPKGMAFRYPHRKDGSRHRTAGAPRTMNLAHLRDKMAGIANLFDGCLTEMGEMEQYQPDDDGW